ncbi:hypothetical protein HMPREF0372_03310 [Flavonifractor plautii ATCC 29863]|uniref:Uncharacterized protein n=1 Tax=Flavonifractor plautii ATCC 29863 TaxID=411475 RepID=G9YUT8_FLAPL|nr:hypothetical protein HMPREF0372_03310 [Flavonifractor plautii ATCC 29863]
MQVLSILGKSVLKPQHRTGYHYILQVSASRFKEMVSLLNLPLFMFWKVRYL